MLGKSLCFGASALRSVPAALLKVQMIGSRFSDQHSLSVTRTELQAGWNTEANEAKETKQDKETKAAKEDKETKAAKETKQATALAKAGLDQSLGRGLA